MKKFKDIVKSLKESSNVGVEDPYLELAKSGIISESRIDILKRAMSVPPKMMTEAEKDSLVEIADLLMESPRQDYLSRFDNRGAKSWAQVDAPAVVVLKRISLRIMDNQKVGLYYSQALDRYITIPFDGARNYGSINEEVTKIKPPAKRIITRDKYLGRKEQEGDSYVRNTHGDAAADIYSRLRQRDSSKSRKDSILNRVPNHLLHHFDGGLKAGINRNRPDTGNIVTDIAAKPLYNVATRLYQGRMKLKDKIINKLDNLNSGDKKDANGNPELKPTKTPEPKARAKPKTGLFSARPKPVKPKYVLATPQDKEDNKNYRKIDNVKKRFEIARKQHIEEDNLEELAVVGRVVGRAAKWAAKKAARALSGDDKASVEVKRDKREEEDEEERGTQKAGSGTIDAYRSQVRDTMDRSTSRDHHGERNTRRTLGQDIYGRKTNESCNFELIKSAHNNNCGVPIIFNEGTIDINNMVATKVIRTYDSLNEENRVAFRNMLNEDYGSFKKAINFTIRQ